MERELCLVLDVSGEHRLVLKRGTDYEIDEYTSKKFEDSSQIREKYKKEINEFLDKYKEVLQNSNNPDYKGRIAVVIPENVGMQVTGYQRRVLFKKHIVAFEKFIKDRSLMIQFSNYERKKDNSLVTEQFHRTVRQRWTTRNRVKGFISEWVKQEKKKKKNYYGIIRDMMIVYEQERGYKTYLPPIDDIYSNYLKQKEEQRKKRLEKQNMKLQTDTSCEEYYQKELSLFDTDDEMPDYGGFMYEKTFR